MLKSVQKAIQEKQYAEAYKLSENLIEFDPTNFQGWLCYANASYHLQKYEDSEKGYSKASVLQPNFPQAWKGLIELFQTTKDHKKLVFPLETLSRITLSKGNITRSCVLTYQAAVSAELSNDSLKAMELLLSLANENSDLYIEREDIQKEIPSLLEIWLKIVRLHILTVNASEINEEYFKTLFNHSSKKQWHDDNPLLNDLTFATDFYVANRIKRIEKAKEKKNIYRKYLVEDCKQILSWLPFSKACFEFLFLVKEFEREEISSKFLEDLMERFPKASVSLILRGEKKLEMKLVQEAYDLIQQGIQDLPNKFPCPLAWKLLTQSYLLLDKEISKSAKSAIECLDKMQKSIEEIQQRFGYTFVPSSFSKKVLKCLEAQGLIKLGMYKEAIELYKQLLVEHSNDPQLLISLVEIYLRLTQFQDAKKFENNLNHYQDNDDALCCLAWISYSSGELETSKCLLERLHERNSLHALGNYRLGLVYWDLGGFYREDRNYSFSRLLQSAKLDPTNSSVFVFLGAYYQEIQKDEEKAIKCYQKALSINSFEENAGRKLHVIYQRRGEIPVFLAYLEKLLLQDDRSKWALLLLAQEQLKNKDFNASILNFQKILAIDPTSNTTWSLLAHAYRNQGKYSASLKAFLKAIELGNTANSVFCEIARIECDLGMYEEAKEHLNLLLKTFPTHFLGLKIYTNVLFSQAKAACFEGRYGQAFTYLLEGTDKCNECIKQKKDSVCLWKQMGDMHLFSYHLTCETVDSKELESFLRKGTLAYEKVTELTPTNNKGFYDLGVSFLYRCWYLRTVDGSICGLMEKTTIDSLYNDLKEKAKECFRKALVLDPLDGVCWNALGIVENRFLVKQYAFIRSIELQRSAEAWGNLGMLYLQINQPKLAREAFLCLQAVDPSSPTMWIGYGLLYEKLQGKDFHEKTIAAFACANQLSQDPDGLLGYAFAVYNTKEYEKALFPLSKYLERDSFNPFAFNLNGIVLRKMGIFEKAKKSFEKAISLLEKMHNSKLLDSSLYQKVTSGVKFNLAKCLSDMGQEKQALETYKLVLSSPSISSSITLSTRLGQSLAAFQLKDYPSAKDSIEKALVLIKDNNIRATKEQMKQLELLLVKLDYYQGKKKEVGIALHQCATKYPDCIEIAQLMVGFASLLNNIKLRESGFHRLEQLEGTLSVRSLLLSALTYQKSLDLSQLLQFLKDVTVLYPKSIELLEYLGWVSMLQGNMEISSRTFLKVTILSPSISSCCRHLDMLSCLNLLLPPTKTSYSNAAAHVVHLRPNESKSWILLACTQIRKGIILQEKKRIQSAIQVIQSVQIVFKEENKNEHEQRKLEWICCLLLSFANTFLSESSIAINYASKAKENHLTTQELESAQLEEIRCLFQSSKEKGIQQCKQLILSSNGILSIQLLIELANAYEQMNYFSCAHRLWEEGWKRSEQNYRSLQIFIGLRKCLLFYKEGKYKHIQVIYDQLVQVMENAEASADLFLGLSLLKMNKRKEEAHMKLQKAYTTYPLNSVQLALSEVHKK